MTAAKVAVIGAGLIGLKHIEILLTLPDVSLIGVVDPAPAARDACAERNLQWFNDVTDLLDNARPDGAIIATPNVLHASIGMRCAENGVHILVEKPITNTVESANALTEACERAGVRLLVGHFRRYNPVLKEARKIVRDGMLGRLLTVRAACLLRKPDEYFKTHWRVNDGGGPILINLVHDIDALRFVCGEMVRVQAIATRGARGLPVEDTAAALIVFSERRTWHPYFVRRSYCPVVVGANVRRESILPSPIRELLRLQWHRRLAYGSEFGVVAISRGAGLGRPSGSRTRACGAGGSLCRTNEAFSARCSWGRGSSRHRLGRNEDPRSYLGRGAVSGNWPVY